MTTEQLHPCRHCAGTGLEMITDLADAPFAQSMTVAERWEVIRDLVGRPSIGQLAYLADSGKRVRWAGHGWVDAPEEYHYGDGPVGTTQHRGRREDCPAPDCGVDVSEVED